MVDHAGSPHSVNESTVVRRGHTASPVHIVRRTVDDFAAIGHWQPSQQSDPMDILPESRASVNPGVADDLYPLPTGCTADDNLNSSFSGELLEALDNAGYSGHQKPHGHNLVMLAEGIPQPSIGLPPQMHSDYDSAPQRDMYLNQPAPVGLWSVLPVSEAPSNGYFQGNTSVAPATDSHGLLDSLRQPLQHYCTGTANNAPWNSQCHRPFTGHCLVNHPYSEGYGCFPKQQDVTANFGPIIQGGNMNSHYDNAPQGVPFGYTAGSCNFYGSRPILSRVMTAPGAHGPHSTSKSTAILASNQLKLPPPRTEKLPTTGTWIDFDARTGDPLPTGKIRRPRSVEEKAVTQQVKELGGPCDKCRGGKRKCDPAHRRMNTGVSRTPCIYFMKAYI